MFGTCIASAVPFERLLTLPNRFFVCLFFAYFWLLFCFVFLVLFFPLDGSVMTSTSYDARVVDFRIIPFSGHTLYKLQKRFPKVERSFSHFDSIMFQCYCTLVILPSLHVFTYFDGL